MKRPALIALALVLVAFGVWYFAVRTPEPRDDFGRFQGEWQLAVPVAEGEKPTARVTPATVRVTGDRWVFSANGKEQKRYAMTLRPEADPKEIDLTQLGPDDKPLMLSRGGKPAPVVLRGVYTIDRDRARVVTAPDPAPRPTGLAAADGPPGWLLDRVK